ncbi:MAG: phytanoyl-CoA dioxygenase family protein [Planctomycetes bacterium]|nr:phytanoyl-CoA dioxygenase family protein [Planctomycetota bacterium]
MSAFEPIRLTPAEVEGYHRDGYLIVERLLLEEEVAAFVEHEARPKPPELNRGLLSHTVDAPRAYVAKHPNVAGIAAQLLCGVPRIVQTMYLAKPPARADGMAGGKGIALHQDTHYLPTEPNTLMACWVAMSETGPENGGLCVVPGSHRGDLRQTHRNLAEDHVSWEHDYLMRGRDGREWKQRMYSFQIEGLDEGQVARLSVARGAGVFFTGMTIHGSYANRSPDRPRLAFAVHYVREGTWVLRADVQDTVAVEKYSKETKGA